MALTRVTSGGIAPGVQITFDQANTPTSPAVTFEGTAGTGIYSPSNNNLAFATGGVERLRIDGSGNITVAGSAFLQVTNNERVVFVSQSDPNASDAEANNGRSINKPFLTIERALIEVARLSYVSGTGDEQGEVGADDFEKYTVIVFPGDYVVDNRPGNANTTGITAGTLGDLYRYNSPNGGVIVPRGTSIVGLDLRKTVVRPRYVPDPETGTESAIFRLTGGCYIWQLTIKDPAGTVRKGSTDTNFVSNPFSCHRIAGFKYATTSDLDYYYSKVNAFDSAIPATTNEFIRRVEENTIVGSKSINQIDTVASASPYVFNVSLRSTYGMCGIHADGSEASGFKSLVVAQFTGISLQKDNDAFNAGKQFTDVTATYKTDWRHYHIKSSNDSFIQVVSVFAVGYADHFVAESGGDMSITNSNSNFGNTAIKSSGFKASPYPLDEYGTITHVVAPKAFGKYISGGNDNDVQKVRWTNIDVQETIAAIGTSGTAQSNARIYIFGAPSDSSYDKSLLASAGGTYRTGLNPTEYLFIQKLSTSDTDDYIQLTLIGNSNPSLDPQNWNWFKYDSTKGKWYVEFNTSGITTLRNEFYNSGEVRSQWELLTSESIFIERRTGTRSADESLWKVRFVVPKERHFQYPGVTNPGRPPEPGYILRTTASSKKVYSIYSVETRQSLTPSTDGIYYLTLLLGDAVSVLNNAISTAAGSDKHYQNKVYLYPTLNPDFPLDNPERTETTWDPDNSVVVVVEPGTTLSSNPDTKTEQIVLGRKRSLTREAIYNLLVELDTVSTVSSYGGSKLDTDAGLNNAYDALMSTNDSNGDPLAVSSDGENRLIEIRNGTDSDDLVSTYDDYVTDLHRPSNIRASGHTWEYVGYGPGNYSTAFPDFQKILLTENNLINAQSVSYDGGASYCTGMNSRGDFYIGNQRINPVTGQPQTLSSPSLLVEGRDNIAAAIDNQISGLQNQISSELAALRNNLTVESLQVNQTLRSDNGIQIGSKQIRFENGQLTPLASEDDYGFAVKASSSSITSVAWKNDADGFITPQILEAWRTANGIVSTVSQSSDIYLCDTIWRDWYTEGERVHNNFWTQSTYGPTSAGVDGSIKYTVLSAINGQTITAANESTALKSWTGDLTSYKQKTITIYKTITVGSITNTVPLTLSPVPFPLKVGNKWVAFNEANYFLPFSRLSTAAEYCNENFKNSATTAVLRLRPGVYHLSKVEFFCSLTINGSSRFSSNSAVDHGTIPLVYWRDEWAKHHKRVNGAYTSTNTTGYKGPTAGVYFVEHVRCHIEQLGLINGFGYQNSGIHVRDTLNSSTIQFAVFLGTLKGLDYELKYSKNDFAQVTTGNAITSPAQYSSPRAIYQGLGNDGFTWLPNYPNFNASSYYEETGDYVGAGNPFEALVRLCTQAFGEGDDNLNYSLFGAGGGAREHHFNSRISSETSNPSANISLRYNVFGPREPVGSHRDRPDYQNFRPRSAYITITGGGLLFGGNVLKGCEKYVVPRNLTSSYVEVDVDGIGGGDDADRRNTITLAIENTSANFGPWINETVDGKDSFTSVGHSAHFLCLENCRYRLQDTRFDDYVRKLEDVSNLDSLYSERRQFVYAYDHSYTRLDNGDNDLYVLHPSFSDRDFTGQKVGLCFVDSSTSTVYDGTTGKTMDSLLNVMYNGLREDQVIWRTYLPVQVVTFQSSSTNNSFLSAGDSGTSTSNPGEIVTGSTSTATGRVLSSIKYPSDNTMRAVIYNIEGTFQSGETITGSTSSQAWVASTAGSKLTLDWNIVSDRKPPFGGKTNRGVSSSSTVSDLGPICYVFQLFSGNMEIESNYYRMTEARDAYNLRFDPFGAYFRGSFGTASVRTNSGTTIDDYTTGTLFRSFGTDGNGARLAGSCDILQYIYGDPFFNAVHETNESGTNNENFLTTKGQYTISNGTTNLSHTTNGGLNSSGPTGDYYHDVRLNMQTHFIHAGNYPSNNLTTNDYVVSGDGRVIYNYIDRYYDALRSLTIGNISKVSISNKTRL